MKISDEGDHMEPEIVYPITCGESKANLIWRKFVCPGINIKCVQVGNLSLVVLCVKTWLFLQYMNVKKK